MQADRLVGGADAVLVIDDTALLKKGTHSVGVTTQYATILGKNANCQTVASITPPTTGGAGSAADLISRV